MTWSSRRSALKHLGALHGRGELTIRQSAESLGPVTYELDIYLDRASRRANGQIEGRTDILTRAFDAGVASLALEDGRLVEVVVLDPRRGGTAEFKVSGDVPGVASPA